MNEQFLHVLQKAERLLDRLDAILPRPLQAPEDWGSALAWRYRRQASGGGVLEAVQHLALMRFDDLLQVGDQKERLLANTRQFMAGQPANNVLLTGARGTGKSSLVRACLAQFAQQGLRLVEVDKSDLVDLPDIVAILAAAPWRFIVYCDDLSFDEGERGYKELKSILDGSIAAATPNVLVYATSNRRHLLPETMADNLHGQRGEDGEIHPGEAVEEKISLSERFGLWLSFYPFSQDEYLAIAELWLRQLGCPAKQLPQARQQALIWALERGSRSGRVAWQFARDYVGRHGLAKPERKAAPKSQGAKAGRSASNTRSAPSTKPARRASSQKPR